MKTYEFLLKTIDKTLQPFMSETFWRMLSLLAFIFFAYYMKKRYGLSADIMESEFWIFFSFCLLLVTLEAITQRIIFNQITKNNKTKDKMEDYQNINE